MAEPVLRLRDVDAGFGETMLWTGLDLDVAPGEFLTVLGGNGAGKTTLLRIVLGLHRQRAGHVEVLGTTARRGNPQVGYLPQHRTFDRDLPVRAADLVRLGFDGHRFGPRSVIARHASADRVRTALAVVGAADFATLPVGRLSGGEQQRVRIAQAIVGAPRLLLADEPLLSLDLAAQRDVAAALDAQRRTSETAVVLVTHEINPVLAFTDRVLYLAAGKWATGTPDEVLTTPSLSALYGVPVEVLRVRDRIVIVGADDAGGVHHDHDVVPR